jgi:hypothetical protein
MKVGNEPNSSKKFLIFLPAQDSGDFHFQKIFENFIISNLTQFMTFTHIAHMSSDVFAGFSAPIIFM